LKTISTIEKRLDAMAGRLGKVLYWLGCIIAGLTAFIGILIYTYEGYGRKDGLIVTGFVLVIAFAIWLIGLALRYILSGPDRNGQEHH
jgi:hypothetical protein